MFSVEKIDGVNRIVEERAKQDERKLGAASFVHVGHDAVTIGGLQTTLSFGLGINADNRVEYLEGLGIGLGDEGPEPCALVRRS